MQRKIIPDVVSGQKLVEMPGSATVFEAAKLMQANGVGSVLVTKDGSLEGIFTERDMVCRVVARGLAPEETSLDQVMTRKPDTIDANATAIEALRLMQDGGYRHLPVVQVGKLVGIVSRRDFFGVEKARLDEETSLWEEIG